jgi:hypothetical protein
MAVTKDCSQLRVHLCLLGSLHNRIPQPVPLAPGLGEPRRRKRYPPTSGSTLSQARQQDFLRRTEVDLAPDHGSENEERLDLRRSLRPLKLLVVLQVGYRVLDMDLHVSNQCRRFSSPRISYLRSNKNGRWYKVCTKRCRSHPNLLITESGSPQMLFSNFFSQDSFMFLGGWRGFEPPERLERSPFHPAT